MLPKSTCTVDRHDGPGPAPPRHMSQVATIYSAIATHNDQKHGQHLLQSTAMTISGFTTSDDEDDDHVVFTQVVNKQQRSPTRRGISSMPIDLATAFTCLADRQSSVTAAVRDHQTSDNKRMVVLKSASGGHNMKFRCAGAVSIIRVFFTL